MKLKPWKMKLTKDTLGGRQNLELNTGSFPHLLGDRGMHLLRQYPYEQSR